MKSLLLALVCLVQFCSMEELKKQPTYAIVAPTKIRPDQTIIVAASVLELEYDSFTVTAAVRMLEEEICSGSYTFTREGSYNIKMKTLPVLTDGNYTIRVSGYSDPELRGQIFTNDTELFVDDKQVSVFIQTSKPFYRQGQTVRMRVIPVQSNLMSVSTTMDVRVKDPNGFVLREYTAQHTNAGGVVSLNYPLNYNLLSYGDWTIEVDCLKHIYNKTFRVEEFFPPLFYVNVSMPTYMLRNSYGLSGLVASNHTTGRGTKGNCTVKLEIHQRQDNSAVPSVRVGEPLYREVQFFDSRTDFLFTREEMEQVAGGPRSLIGKELRVTGFVRDWFYNTTANGYQSALVYSEDVQLKFLGGHVWTFKPDLPLKIYIAAQKRDGSPLDPYNENRTINLQILETIRGSGVVERLSSVQIPTDTSVAELTLNPTQQMDRILIIARYEGLEDTRREFVASRFWSPNDFYIQLTTPTRRPTVGEYMIFNVKTNIFVDKIFYYIVAAGNIIVSDSLQMYSRNKLFSIALSREMAPSARILAFYVAPDGQVVTDSMNFHVNGTKLHEMTLKFNRGKDFSYGTVELTATADPLSYVAFSAIEYQLYELGARNGLTWEEVYQELYSFDDHANTSIRHYWQRNGQTVDSFYAPTPTFAKDANSTFFYAGLYIFTDANASAVFTNCNMTKGEFPCGDGLTCYNHREWCTGHATCPNDYKDQMGCPTNDTFGVKLYDDDRLWRTKHIGKFFMDGGFMWKDQFTKPDGRIDIKVNVPTYPGTWVVSGFAMSRENGLAILPIPARFDGVRPMYISVQGPQHVNEGEHMALRVSLFNFWDEQMDILLQVDSSPDYQFVNWDRDAGSFDGATPVDGVHHVLVPVFPGGNRQVYIPIVPRRRGHMKIPISALCSVGGHTVVHHVYVEKYGVPEHYLTNYQVDLTQSPSVILPDMIINVQETYLTAEKRLLNYVPGSPHTTINIMGDIVGTSFFPKLDYNLNSENLLVLPYGTGSEAVFNFAVNLRTWKTLKSMSTVPQETSNKVVYTLNLAMQGMLSYMEEDGSFKEFRWGKQSGVWLTALALQALSDGRVGTKDLEKQFQVPVEALTNAAMWLASQQDNKTGIFSEIGPIYNRRMASHTQVNITHDNGTRETIDGNIALTSFCVISLTSAPDLAGMTGLVNEVVSSSARYLNRVCPQEVTDPFELAICTYALLKSGQTNGVPTLGKLKDKIRGGSGFRYWSTHPINPMKGDHTGTDTQIALQFKNYTNVTSYAVAATSYAMLSYMENSEDKAELNDMQRFLQEQHMHIGGFSSTVDSLVALQALSELALLNQDRKAYEMSFIIKSDQVKEWSHGITLNQNNWFNVQSVDTPSHWGNILIEAKGHGLALVQMDTSVHYEHRNLLRPPPNPGVFDLGGFNENIRTSGFNHSMINYNICPTWHGPSETSGMAVLEVGVPSGYIVANKSLQAFVRKQENVTTLRNAEFYAGKAVFYYDYLDRSEKNCAKFTAVRWYPVANVTEQQMLRVFEYYEPGNFLYTFYEKIELTKLTVCLVCGSYQCPYCPHYASANYHVPSVQFILFAAVVAIVTKQWLATDWHL